MSFSIYGMTKHPQIDELVILYGASGHSRLIDIIKGTCVWHSKESGLYRKIVERTAPIDDCQFSPDGKKILLMTVLGTVTMFSTDNAACGSNLAPVEQYFKFEFENPPDDLRMKNQ